MAKTRTLADDRDYAALVTRRETLKGERDVARRAIDDLNTQLGRLGGGPFARSRVELEAAQLLGEAAGDPMVSAAQLRQGVQDHQHQVRVLDSAIAQLERRIERRRDELLPSRVAPFVTEYKAAVRNYAETLVELARRGAALDRIRAAADEATGGSTLGYLRPMGLPLGSLEDWQSPVQRFLAECREHGFEVPETPELAEAARRAEAQAAKERAVQVRREAEDLRQREARQAAQAVRERARDANWQPAA